MADKKTESVEDGYDVLWKLVGFVIFLLVVGNILSKQGYMPDDTVQENPQEDKIEEVEIVAEVSQESDEKKPSILSTLFSNELVVGKKIINKEKIKVYKNPANTFLGYQNKYESGKILEGPFDVEGENWWKVDYRKAPDGFVNSDFISTRVWFYKTIYFLIVFFEFLRSFAMLISIILIILIVIVMLKIKGLDDVQQKKEEFEKQKNVNQQIFIEQEIADNPMINNLPTGNNAPITEDVHNKRWINIQNLINSHNVNDWKQAILEADIILDEMLDKMGYKGPTMAEKLKQVEPSDFFTLEKAWEAHKIRNMIAHKGTSYVLTRNDAEKAIKLYEEVFKEFYYI